jgi:hypothetical protein
MKRPWLAVGGLVLSAVVLFGLGCGSGGQGKIRVMNASPDIGSLNILIDGKNVSSSLSYPGFTDYLSVASGSRKLEVQTVSSTTDLVDQNVSVSSGGSTTVMLVNYASDLSVLTLTDDNTAPTSGNFKMRIVNASPTLGPMDVYIVPQGENITNVNATITSLAFKSASPYQTLTAGAYEVYFTLPNTKSVYIPTGPLTLESGQIRTVVAINGTGGGYDDRVLNDLN